MIRFIHTLASGPELFAWSSIRKLDGLALGSLLAAGLRLRDASHVLCRYAPKVALFAGSLFLLLIFVPRRLVTGYYWTAIETISVILFGGVLILILRQAGTLPRIRKNRGLIAFGKYSYGIYVIHNICLPLFQWLFNPATTLEKSGSPLLAQAIFYSLAVSSAFLLAFISWHLCERNFLS